MRKISVILVLIGLALVSTERYCYALFDSGDKEPRLQNDSYEKLVNKNLELRKEVDTLIKEQEQLREIYKLLLEKVKALQRGNALALKDKEDSVSAAEKANQIIGKTKKELADADSKIAELSALMNKASTEVKSGTDTYYEMNIMRLKDSVKSYEKKYGEAIAEKSGLDKTLAAKNTELAAKNTELAAKSAELADIRGNIAGQEGLSKKLTDDINTRDAEANIRAKKIDELSGQLKASLEKQAAFDRELTEARGLSKKRETEA
ncbi:MAG: hypothetical protein Q7S07_05545, partial [Candidatus Omnitrophota bacterium]|nr:hypothetical protein [Candidatus Omnitrophota bacterium]